MGKRKRVRSKKGADNPNRATIIHTNRTVSGDKRDGASTSGGSNVPLHNNEGGVSNFPRKKKVRRKKLNKAKKVEKTDLVQTSCPTMMVKIHGSNGSSSEHVEKSYADNYMEPITVENGIAGFIFMCSEKTKHDCYRYRVFGLPAGKLEVVKKIRKGAKLFLYDFNLKILHGIYTASSDGEKNLEAYAFGGSFPAQVVVINFFC